MRAPSTGREKAQRRPTGLVGAGVCLNCSPVAKSASGNSPGGRQTNRTPTSAQVAIISLQIPQGSLRMKREKIMVKLGLQKKMAVQSPRGILVIASIAARRRKAPNAPETTTLHWILKSPDPNMPVLARSISGSMQRL